jgi:hypothetical protein
MALQDPCQSPMMQKLYVFGCHGILLLHNDPPIFNIMSCGIYRIFCCLAEFDSSFKTLFNDQQVPDMYIVSALRISWKLAIERLFLEPKKHSTNFKILLPILSQINIFTCRT